MNLLLNKSGRRLFAFAFYFAEGAPIGFIWWAMPTLLRQNGAEINTIGSFTALLTMPWVFKFLWAPLVDVFRSSRFGYKGWIAISQILMCLTLLPLLFVPLQGNIQWWMLLLLLHSLCAATQDVAVDAIVIHVIAEHEKGMLNGFMQAGMLVGRSIFGGGALVLASQWGLNFTISVLMAAIASTMCLLFFIHEPLHKERITGRLTHFKQNIVKGFGTANTWHALLFALLGAAAMEAGGAMAGPYLTDRHISIEQIGFFFSIPVVVAMLLGGLTGGYLSDRIGRKKSVALFLSGAVLMVAILSILDYWKPGISDHVFISLFIGMYFFTGMFTSASYALFMDMTNPALGATQFSTFMAATNGCESWVVWSAGMIAALHGYPVAFAVMCIVSVGSLLFLMKINKNKAS